MILVLPACGISQATLPCSRAETVKSWLMQALHPLFGASEEDAVRDNAIGAAARIISASAAPPSVLPQVQYCLTQILGWN